MTSVAESTPALPEGESLRSVTFRLYKKISLDRLYVFYLDVLRRYSIKCPYTSLGGLHARYLRRDRSNW